MRLFSSPRAAILLVPAALILCSCTGGNDSAPPAPPNPAPTTLTYVNNPSGTTSTWRAEVDPATNGTAAVTLNVYGPAGLQIKGATAFITCSTRAIWTAPPGAADPYAGKGSALDLTTQGSNPAIQLFKSKLSASAKDLQVGAYQKQGSVTLGADPLFSVALTVKPNTTAGKATLDPTAGKSCIYLDAAGAEHTFPLILGELTSK